MIRAFLLIFVPSRTWEAIKNDQHGVVRLSLAVLLPILGVSAVAEGYLLMQLGVERGSFTQKLVKVPPELALRYELVQTALSLGIVYLGSLALQQIGASFHRRHTYQECFTTLAYSLSPLFVLRILGGVPALDSWAAYGVGIFLTLSLFYRGVPFILRPDPSNALGLFVSCAFLLLIVTGLAQFVASMVLQEKLLA